MRAATKKLTLRHDMFSRESGARGPEGVEGHGHAEHDRLPDGEMKHVEDVAFVQAEEIERDDAQKIECFQSERPGQEADHALPDRRFKAQIAAARKTTASSALHPLSISTANDDPRMIDPVTTTFS